MNKKVSGNIPQTLKLTQTYSFSGANVLQTISFTIPKKIKKHSIVGKKMEFSEKEIVAIKSLISDLDANISVVEFLDFLVKAIQERERVKFEFTRNLSRALDLSIELGKQLDLSRDEISFLTYSDLEQLKLNTIDKKTIINNIEIRKQAYLLKKQLNFHL